MLILARTRCRALRTYSPAACILYFSYSSLKVWKLLLILCTKDHWPAVVFPVRMFSLKYICGSCLDSDIFPLHIASMGKQHWSNENVFKTVRPLMPWNRWPFFLLSSPLSLPYLQSENLGNPLLVCNAGSWTQSLVSTHWARAQVVQILVLASVLTKGYCDRFLALGILVAAAGRAQHAEPRQVYAPCASTCVLQDRPKMGWVGLLPRISVFHFILYDRFSEAE